jgi:FtsZ-interacting cell division protein YlmF
MGMGLFDKIKKSLFVEDEDKLVQDERTLRSLNPNYNKNTNSVTFTEATPTQNTNTATSTNRVVSSNTTTTPASTGNFSNSPSQSNFFDEYISPKKNVNIIKNFYPVEYKEIEDIAKAILEGYTVEVDLSSMANENIVRTLDFLSGLTYGRGKVNRRSKYEFTFVINE